MLLEEMLNTESDKWQSLSIAHILNESGLRQWSEDVKHSELSG